MTRLTKWLAISAGIVVLIPVALYVAVSLFFFASNVPSKIADFRPTSFEAKANSKFFYSIGNELKYSDQIDPKAQEYFQARVLALTLLRAMYWRSFQCSDSQQRDSVTGSTTVGDINHRVRASAIERLAEMHMS